MNTPIKETLDAFLAAIFHEFRPLTDRERADLRSFAQRLKKLIPLFKKHQGIRRHLISMVEHASGHLKTRRTSRSIFGDYEVSYSRGVNGPKSFLLDSGVIARLSRKGMRVGVEASIPSSRNPSLLMGEIFQHIVPDLLRKSTLGRKRVVDVRPLKSPARLGRRVDDWLVILDNGSGVPVEVKSSGSKTYFLKAFGQIRNERKGCDSVLFIGILYPQRKIGIALVKRTASRLQFREAVYSLFQKSVTSP